MPARLPFPQDRVPAFSSDKAQAIIERELGAPVGELFRDFDPRPLAAASLGQVHAATLHSGEAVAVKVQRPGLRQLFDIDLENLGRVAEQLDRGEEASRDFRGIYKVCVCWGGVCVCWVCVWMWWRCVCCGCVDARRADACGPPSCCVAWERGWEGAAAKERASRPRLGLERGDALWAAVPRTGAAPPPPPPHTHCRSAPPSCTRVRLVSWPVCVCVGGVEQGLCAGGGAQAVCEGLSGGVVVVVVVVVGSDGGGAWSSRVLKSRRHCRRHCIPPITHTHTHTCPRPRD